VQNRKKRQVPYLIASKCHSFNQGSLALKADHREHQFGQRRSSTQMAHCWMLPATASQEAESVGQQAMRVPCIALLTLDWRRACTTFKVCLVHIDRPAVAAEQGLGCHDVFLFVVRRCGCVVGLLVDVVSGLFKSQVGKPASGGRVLGNGADGGASVSRSLR
jgi:hypothetical protein